MDTHYAEQLFIDEMSDESDMNRRVLLCELQHLAAEEKKTPEQVLWIVEARVERKVRETRSLLAKALEEACIPVQQQEQ
jgi:hypothetical protein